MLYQIFYQEDEGVPAVVSAFLETQNVRPSPGTSWEPVLVTKKKAKALLKQALLEGYRPTGDLTRELLGHER